MAKAPPDLRSLARSHTKSALDTINGLSLNATSEKVRLEAAALLLDRGWGKVAQPLTGSDGEGPIVVEIIHRERSRDVTAAGAAVGTMAAISHQPEPEEDEGPQPPEGP